MSAENPKGAIEALLAREYVFRARLPFPLRFVRRRVPAVLTLGALAAVDLMGLESAPCSDAAVVGCILYASTRSPRSLARELRRGKAAFSARMLRFARRHLRSPADWSAARRIVEAMLADVRAASCSYDSPFSGADKGLPREWGLGDRCAAVSLLMRVYKMPLDEAWALPVTTANMLYFAEAEHRGLRGMDTFLNRETLEGAEAILAQMKFE